MMRSTPKRSVEGDAAYVLVDGERMLQRRVRPLLALHAIAEPADYTVTRHQREVGTGYVDSVAEAISSGASSTLALAQSTEARQF